MHLQENTLFDLGYQGYIKCYSVPSTSCNNMHLQSLKCMLRPTVRRYFYKKIHYLTSTLDVKFEIATSNSVGDVFTSKYII